MAALLHHSHHGQVWLFMIDRSVRRLRRSFHSGVMVVFWLSALHAGAQSLSVREKAEACYARSTRLITSDRMVEHQRLIDSLATARNGSASDSVLHVLLRARHMRHVGQLQRAYQLLDSLASADSGLDPYFAYLDHYQQAKSLQDLGIHEKAKVEARLAITAAAEAGLPERAMQMELLLCEIDLHGDSLHEAQACFSRALADARRTDHTEGICRALIGIGNVYYAQEQDSAALTYYEQALAVARDRHESSLTVSALLNMGASLSYTVGPDSAIGLYRSVLDTATSRSLDASFRADLLTNMASMLSDIDEHGAALAFTDSALALQAALHDTSSMAYSHLFKATALWHLDRRNEAVDQALLARDRSGSIDLKVRATKKAADYLRAIGRTEEAFVLLNEYTTLADSVARSRYNTGVAGAQVRFETSEKERRIAEQDQALELAAANDRRKSTQRNAFIVATALLILLALLLYRNIRHRARLARKEEELHHEQVDQLLSQQEIKSINAMLEGQEKERERVSKELHDHVGHLLGTIKHQLGELQTQVADVKSEQTAQYQKVSGLLDNAAGELRRISHDMAAATLNRFGLEKALKDLSDTLHINGCLQVELNTFGLERPLERGVEIAVYRIIQEAVSNALKHAKATELTIGVTHAPGRLSVVVSDNGIGFDTSATNGGVGLGNIRARAVALGALVQIDSTPGKGTTVNVECAVLE
ncbi:MAG: sensor histidine kinase [Flavobacteriales bacterium]|nr:sensor histidine kinase [Flavobacteriales bacterium]